MPIFIAEAINAVQATHTLHIAGQLALLRCQRQPAGVAKPMLTRFKLMIKGHPAIKNKALPLPATLDLWHLLEIAQDATF